MVRDSKGFLKELCRITKPDGILYLEDGHQPRSVTKEKVNNSGCWEIVEETKGYLMCRPALDHGHESQARFGIHQTPQ